MPASGTAPCSPVTPVRGSHAECSIAPTTQRRSREPVAIAGVPASEDGELRRGGGKCVEAEVGVLQSASDEWEQGWWSHLREDPEGNDDAATMSCFLASLAEPACHTATSGNRESPPPSRRIASSPTTSIANSTNTEAARADISDQGTEAHESVQGRSMRMDGAALAHKLLQEDARLREEEGEEEGGSSAGASRGGQVGNSHYDEHVLGSGSGQGEGESAALSMGVQIDTARTGRKQAAEGPLQGGALEDVLREIHHEQEGLRRILLKQRVAEGQAAVLSALLKARPRQSDAATSTSHVSSKTFTLAEFGNAASKLCNGIAMNSTRECRVPVWSPSCAGLQRSGGMLLWPSPHSPKRRRRLAL